MNVNFRQSVRKHNGFLAMFLSLVLVISCSLQLVHDQLLDHQHDSDCAMYVVDGNTAIGNSSSDCIAFKQKAEQQLFSSFTLVISQFNHHAPRAPPLSL